MIGSFALLLGLICALSYGGWSALREIQKVTLAPVDTAIDDGTPLQSGAEGPVVEANATAPSLDRIERLYRPQALDTPVFVARDGPISALDPREQGAYAAYSPSGALAPAAIAPPDASTLRAALLPDTSLAPEAENSSGPLTDTGSVQVTAAAPPEVVIFAREPVWVRVRAADGTILLEKILDGGERYVLPATEAAPTLRAGNSGALYFAVNGQTIGPAGEGTSIARNVSLGATELTASYDPVDLNADPELARLAQLVIQPETPVSP